MTKKPTLADVAALAQVGSTTVARVLRGGPNVRDEVRARVLAAAEKLQYSVNLQASFLARGGGRSIGIVYASSGQAEPNSFYHTGLELGAMRACMNFGFRLAMHPINPHARAAASTIEQVASGQDLDGLILTPPFCDDGELLERLVRRGLRLVCVSPGAEGAGRVLSVGIDDEAASFEITTHLLSLGHRRFGYIQGLADFTAAERRFAGFQRALARQGLGASDMITARGAFTFQSGVMLGRAMLESAARPSALVCANDDMAVGAVLSAHELGLSVPRDVSIVGFDNTPASEVIWPPLTTVDQPLRRMGYRAVERLVESMKAARAASLPLHENMPHSVVTRRSTAPPRLG